MFSTGKNDWSTPDSLFKRYDDIYHFILDAAADSTNHKCKDWLGPGGLHEDALVVSWQPWLTNGNIFLNPPYQRPYQQRFVEKAANEAIEAQHGKVVCLLPSRTDTKLFHQVIKKFSVELEFLPGRLKFGNSKNSAPFPSLICIF